jgi:aspartyl/asparaginyl-tRNA synthetase
MQRINSIANRKFTSCHNIKISYWEKYMLFSYTVADLSDEEDSDEPKLFFRNPAYLTVSGQLHLEIITG